MDWKEQLAAFADNNDMKKVPEKPQGKPQNNAPAKSLGTLYIRFERRNGKPATIISEFGGTEEALKDLAKSVKTTLGVGGSARDDEILLQGDVRKKLAVILRNMGYRLKGEV